VSLKLTKQLVDSTNICEKDYILWDSQLPGFGLRVFSSGTKSYIIQYRNAAGRNRRMSLGKHGVLTVEEARKLARQQLAAVARGEDPSASRQEFMRSMSVTDLCERFMNEHAAHHCKPRTIENYRRDLDRFIKPALGGRKITEIERKDIAALHGKYSHIPYQANRNLMLLSAMFNKAEEWGLRQDGSNPCRHVKRYPQKNKERYLTKEEMAKLIETLDYRKNAGLENPFFVAAIKLLLFTGARLGEIQTAKWEYLRENILELPDSKTGKKRIYLGTAALNVLTNLPRFEDNPYIIAGRKKGAYLENIHGPWKRVREAAGLEDVRIHDLRHTFAAYAATNRLSLHMTGKLLGHSQPQTTMRYAHLADAPMLEAAEQVNDAMTLDIFGEPNTSEPEDGDA